VRQLLCFIFGHKNTDSKWEKLSSDSWVSERRCTRCKYLTAVTMCTGSKPLDVNVTN
jgi:hypothetical protein